MQRTTRRDFLATAISAAGVSAVRPADGLAALSRTIDGLLPGQDPWPVVREAFLIPEDRIYLNVGTLGPQPRAVVDAVSEHTRRVATTFPPRTDWEALKVRLGALVHCDPAGLVFPRNTTEGMNFVANGLDLEAGDQVLTTNHEHIGGLCPWQLVAARRGLDLRQLELPLAPVAGGEIVDLFRRAITPRTRVISVSHVTFTTGLILPVAALVQLCRENGIIAVVDGAHPPGMMGVDLGALDPDFYASSPHKWLLAPQGTGFLYMREEWRSRLWPTLASGGWDDASLGAQRFNHLGTLDESRLAGLDAALAFHEAIGSDRIAARVASLRRLLIDRLSAMPAVELISSRDDTLCAGMVSFHIAGMDSLELQRRLSSVETSEGTISVRTRVISEYDYGLMRLSAHIYNTADEIERVVELIDEATRAG